MVNDLRVVHIDDGRGFRGGQHQVWLLMTELAARGVAQVLVAPPGAPLTERARAAGIAVEPLNFHGEWDPFAPRRIAALARAFNANILHTHTGHAHALGLRAARRLAGAVRFVTTRRVDFAVGKSFFSRRKYTAPEQHFIAISEGVRRVLIEGGVAAERIDRVFSGVPPISPAEAWPRERVRASLGIKADEIAIVNVGALTDHKGQRWLIEAAPAVLATFPRVRVHLLGEGELRGTLESQIRELGLEGKVILHGHVDSARLKLAGFDLFVSSSHLEGLGTAILDAMLAGLPVVAAAAGGVTDIVKDGLTGRLVPPRDSAALGLAMILALREPGQSQTMAKVARRMVEDTFSARAMAEGTLAVYRKLLA